MALPFKKAAAIQRHPSDIAEDLLPGTFAGGVSDFLGGFPSSRYRQGKAQAITDAMGYDAPLALKRPMIHDFMGAGIGAGVGGLIGAGAGALTGNTQTGAILGGAGGFGLGGLIAAIKRQRGIGDVKRTLAQHLKDKKPLDLQEPELGSVFGSGSMDAGNVDAYLALKNKEKVNPRTISGSVASELAPIAHILSPIPGVGAVTMPAASWANRSYARGRLNEDTDTAISKPERSAYQTGLTKKTAAALYNVLVKQASLITLDAFLTKVAAALPMAKRAAFRSIQAELSSGSTLAQSIKVAFPRLSGEQRGALAVNLCKCAADSEYKTRTFESYALPVKEGNKSMREKCSKDGKRGLFPNLRNAQQQRQSRGTATRVAPTASSPAAPEQPAAMSPALKMSTEGMASDNIPYSTILGMLAKTPANPFHAITNPVGHATVGAAGHVLGGGDAAPAPAASAASADLASTAPDAKSGMNPYLLGALGVGGLGLGAYGLSHMMSRKKRRDEE